MAIINIDKLLADKRGKNHIARVGIEMEGGWAKRPPTPVERDSSVKFDSNSGITMYAVGEVASPVIEPVMIRSWVLNNYPAYVNESCGLHIHQSFSTPLHYMALMDEDYQQTMLEYLKRWGKQVGIPEKHCLWDRLNGKSEYCQLKHWPDRQVLATKKDYDRTKEGHRYTAINYCHGLHGMETIEVRVLPMFEDADHAVSALELIVDVTNACLEQLVKKHKNGRIVIGNLDLSSTVNSVDYVASQY